MKVIVQKVLQAKCISEGVTYGKIDKGYMLLVSFTFGDTLENIKKMAKKVSGLRIFDDAEGKMNLSIHDIEGSILSISQFTLYADPYSGNRPSFGKCLNGDEALILYNLFNEELRKNYHLVVEEGHFGHHMQLDISCDGPATIELEY